MVCLLLLDVFVCLVLVIFLEGLFVYAGKGIPLGGSTRAELMKQRMGVKPRKAMNPTRRPSIVGSPTQPSPNLPYDPPPAPKPTPNPGPYKPPSAPWGGYGPGPGSIPAPTPTPSGGPLPPPSGGMPINRILKTRPPNWGPSPVRVNPVISSPEDLPEILDSYDMNFLDPGYDNDPQSQNWWWDILFPPANGGGEGGIWDAPPGEVNDDPVEPISGGGGRWDNPMMPPARPKGGGGQPPPGEIGIDPVDPRGGDPTEGPTQGPQGPIELWPPTGIPGYPSGPVGPFSTSSNRRGYYNYNYSGYDGDFRHRHRRYSNFVSPTYSNFNVYYK